MTKTAARNCAAMRKSSARAFASSSSKQYWSQFERSPDFVVLFLPGDQFLAAALQENPGLIDEALRQNVMLATPDQSGRAAEGGLLWLEADPAG